MAIFPLRTAQISGQSAAAPLRTKVVSGVQVSICSLSWEFVCHQGVVMRTRRPSSTHLQTLQHHIGLELINLSFLMLDLTRVPSQFGVIEWKRPFTSGWSRLNASVVYRKTKVGKSHHPQAEGWEKCSGIAVTGSSLAAKNVSFPSHHSCKYFFQQMYTM